ncbi:D-alanyl-D-alanine carboxypeptidase family protein [Aminobacter niigataensis]|uniref:D-alanyl-D-alanine carboxypeptidase family protein n=1 Tax=Aminobacter niigataensis TaxID=83265 RepID=UPI00298EEDF5|nr:D-alanyl-D-alanine carboxypeptidase family protein [Aminobacter niigataensis]
MPALFRQLAALLAVAALLTGCATTETLSVAPPAAPEKYAAIVVDASNGRTLFQAYSTAPRYPASLTKMMTLYLTFEAMQQGRVSKTTLIPVSENARSQPPSKLGFKRGEQIELEAAVRALATKSANDVAVAVGEYLGGSEEGFARLMTSKARQLGMTATVFRNASGLPDAAQRTTARDMAVLGMALRKHFPQHYYYFSATDFNFRGKRVRGHNDLLGRVNGVDGIKTGYIRASGFNIVTSVNADGRKLVIVVMGGDSARKRNAHVEELIVRYMPQASGGSLASSLFQPAAQPVPMPTETAVAMPAVTSMPAPVAAAAPASGPVPMAEVY